MMKGNRELDGEQLRGGTWLNDDYDSLLAMNAQLRVLWGFEN